MARSRRVRFQGNQQLNLTPLLDVVLQLITFFMMLVHFGTRIEGSTRVVRLPVTASAMPRADLGIDRLAVVIDSGGSLIDKDKALRDRASEAWWIDQARLRREGRELLGGPASELATRVIIRADRQASYGAVRRQLVSAQKAGFAHFTLVVLRSQR